MCGAFFSILSEPLAGELERRAAGAFVANEQEDEPGAFELCARAAPKIRAVFRGMQARRTLAKLREKDELRKEETKITPVTPSEPTPSPSEDPPLRTDPTTPPATRTIPPDTTPPSPKTTSPVRRVPNPTSASLAASREDPLPLRVWAAESPDVTSTVSTADEDVAIMSGGGQQLQHDEAMSSSGGETPNPEKWRRREQEEEPAVADGVLLSAPAEVHEGVSVSIAGEQAIPIAEIMVRSPVEQHVAVLQAGPFAQLKQINSLDLEMSVDDKINAGKDVKVGANQMVGGVLHIRGKL